MSYNNMIRFVGLPFDGDRKPPLPADLRRLAEAVERQGFRIAPAAEDESGSSLDAWQDSFHAVISLSEDWLAHVVIDAAQLNPDSKAGRANVAALADLIDAVGAAADTYIGFVSNHAADDLAFVVEDPPVRVENPLALVYLGERYLNDWPADEPAFAAGAEVDVVRTSGRLIVPSMAELVSCP